MCARSGSNHKSSIKFQILFEHELLKNIFVHSKSQFLGYGKPQGEIPAGVAFLNPVVSVKLPSLRSQGLTDGKFSVAQVGWVCELFLE